MTSPAPTFEIFISTFPGLEDTLLAEIKAAGFTSPAASRGGVTIRGDWRDVWRANLVLRGASKVLVRIGHFRAFHLAQLDKRARKFPWAEFLPKTLSIKVETHADKRSKIYHSGAATERIERAISEELGAPIAQGLEDAQIVLKVRISDNNVIVSLDSSGDGLHKRGFKHAMGKAPLRETMAALILRRCGYSGDEPVLDPMCGSGTLVIEAAEIARGLLPGRERRFTFEHLPAFKPEVFARLKQNHPRETPHNFYGSDRNVKVIGMAKENAGRAGVADICYFTPRPISALERPDGPPGLVMTNPPYGARVGKKNDLFALHKSFGDVMRERFSGWRVGMITTDDPLAKAAQLPWKPPSAPIAHGGLKVRLWQTGPLP